MIDLDNLQNLVLDYMNGNPPADISKKDSDRFRKVGNSHERLLLTDEVHLEKFYKWRGHYILHQPTAIAIGERFLVVKGEHPRLLNSPQGQDILERVIQEISQTSKYDNLSFWNSFLTLEMNQELVESLEEQRRGSKKPVRMKKPTKATLF